MERNSPIPPAGRQSRLAFKLMDLLIKAWLRVWKRLPREQRGGVLKSLAENYLSSFLGDMSREDRASLMNGLLPLVAREFPLADLDFLTAFSSPDNFSGESGDESGKTAGPNYGGD